MGKHNFAPCRRVATIMIMPSQAYRALNSTAYLLKCSWKPRDELLDFGNILQVQSDCMCLYLQITECPVSVVWKPGVACCHETLCGQRAGSKRYPKGRLKL